MEDLLNYLFIRPGLATSGQPEPEQFEMVRAAGTRAVINLVPESSGEWLPEEAGIVACLGMEYLHIPVLWDAPSAGNLARYFQALDARRGSAVLAHCVVNYRVSAFTFLYRVLREGEPVAAARARMHAIWEPNPIWARFLKEHLEAGGRGA